jgi:hypothetical protein
VQSTINHGPELCVWLERSRGGTRTKLRDSLARETANLNTCLAKEGNGGTNKYNKFKPERQQELKLVFGQ